MHAHYAMHLIYRSTRYGLALDLDNELSRFLYAQCVIEECVANLQPIDTTIVRELGAHLQTGPKKSALHVHFQFGAERYFRTARARYLNWPDR